MSLIKRIEPEGTHDDKSKSHQLPDVADFFMKRLTPATRAQLKANAQGGVLRVGTLCSGTDSPIPVIEHLGKKIGLTVEHVFSCEWAPKKQEWIRRNFEGLKYLFSDVKEVGFNENATDVLTGKQVKVPTVDLIIAGFVCKSVSTENNERDKYASCIDLATGQTGETFSGTAAYIKRHSPKLVICENVEGLAKRIGGTEPQVFSVMRAFENLGYASSWSICDSRHFQLPQRRRRCWMWASKYAQSEAVEKDVPQTLARLASNAHMPLHKMLKKGMDKTLLLAREKQVIATAMGKLKSTHDDDADVIVDIAKSDQRAPVCIGATSCIVPNSKPYHMASKRVLTPEEVLKEKGGNNLARDLAGNAFTSTVCMAVLVSSLAHCPLQGRKRSSIDAMMSSPATPPKRRRVAADASSPIKSSPSKTRRSSPIRTRKSTA
mmetsp:Transcript_20109/g.45100  ORF Transcript_20109/g.45100 Transcript_20109/m.45100 type:complete len:434 (-) Transcript_20109:266-1567(-)